MPGELEARYQQMIQSVHELLAGRMLDQAIDHLLAAAAMFEQVGEIVQLREEYRTYGRDLAAMLAPVVKAAGDMAAERAAALEKQIEAEKVEDA